MKLKVVRTTYTDTSTISDLYVDGVKYCFVLEDKVRGVNEKKIFGKTAIPAGTYTVILSYSNRFEQYMPLLCNVPGYEGVRIHWGNDAAATEGCLLVGNGKTKDFISNSKATYAKFLALIKKVEKKEKITLEIVDTK